MEVEAMKSPSYEGNDCEIAMKSNLKCLARKRHDALKNTDPKQWLLWEIMIKAEEAKVSVQDFREVLESARISSFQHSQVMMRGFEIADWR